ncbi:AAA family ATPase [Candidatus Dojkabacteria bacterium]|jgi:DNA repair exonuclease SbcCD ATPase subunit/DNA repair exonuclease SbcCD nuclease subunit|nr:AAA family ATPase [Candidatus Dojkabacteria bacterium]
MRIAQIADIHISETRSKEFEVLLAQLAKSIVHENPDIVVFCGDLFMHRDKLTPEQVKLANIFFKQQLKNFKQIIIIGNHDISMSASKIDSISAVLFGDIAPHVKIGEKVIFDDYCFHLFSYPSRRELDRLGIKDSSLIFENDNLFDSFKFEVGKKNILVYHGTLEGFNISDSYRASEETISVGKECALPKKFWSKFDAVMAGHLHKYQTIDNAIYPGVPFPLTFKDDEITGYVIWEDLSPRFVELPQLYPYKTIDIGSLTAYVADLTGEAVRRADNNYDFTNSRVRIKYKVNSTQSGNVNHAEISKCFANAKEIKVVPEYLNSNDDKIKVSFEDFQHHNIAELVNSYIDNKKYSPDVKKVSAEVEAKIQEKYSSDDGRGLHFRPVSLKVSNFKSLGEDNPQINFDQLDNLVGVFGENKTGKSSLIESIVWALFGETVRNKDVKSVIRNGEKEASVELVFDSYGVKYKIERIRGLTSAGLFLSALSEKGEWTDMSGGTVTNTQKMIDKLVGTFEMFTATIYSPQSNIDLLIKKKPGERKQIILDCLQVDVLTRRQEVITEMRKEVKEEIIQEKGRALYLTEQITSLISKKPSEIINSFEAKLNTAKTEAARLNTHVSSLTKKIIEYESYEAEYHTMDVEIKKLRMAIDSEAGLLDNKKLALSRFVEICSNTHLVDEGLARERVAHEEYNKYLDEQRLNMDRKNKRNELLKRKQQEGAKFKENFSILNDSKTRTENSLKNLTLLNCSRADCPLNDNIKKQQNELILELDKIEDQTSQAKESYSAALRALDESIRGVDTELQNSFFNQADMMRWMNAREAEKSSRWEEIKHKVESSKEVLDSYNEIISMYQTKLTEMRKKRDDLINRRSEIAQKLDAVVKYKKELTKARIEFDKQKDLIENCAQQIYKAKRDLDEVNKLQTQLVETRNKMDELEQYLNHCNKYADIVGKQGVVFSLVEKALPIIERFAQMLLSDTTDGLVSLSIDSYKLLSKGEKKDDEVAIYMIDTKGKRDISEASGAETVLLSLVLRAAISHLLSLRMGSKVELFIVDEGFGAFDVNNISSIKGMLKRLGEEFNKVLFITHVPELKDVAQSVIEVYIDGSVSTFKIKGAVNE